MKSAFFILTISVTPVTGRGFDGPDGKPSRVKLNTILPPSLEWHRRRSVSSWTEAPSRTFGLPSTRTMLPGCNPIEPSFGPSMAFTYAPTELTPSLVKAPVLVSSTYPTSSQLTSQTPDQTLVTQQPSGLTALPFNIPYLQSVGPSIASLPTSPSARDTSQPSQPNSLEGPSMEPSSDLASNNPTLSFGSSLKPERTISSVPSLLFPSLLPINDDMGDDYLTTPSSPPSPALPVEIPSSAPSLFYTSPLYQPGAIQPSGSPTRFLSSETPIPTISMSITPSPESSSGPIYLPSAGPSSPVHESQAPTIFGLMCFDFTGNTAIVSSRVGDGWCDDGSLGLGDYNSEYCDYDGGDCCPLTCRNNTMGTQREYPCGIAGYACIDPGHKNMSAVSNFTIEVIATNFTREFVTEAEVNSVFLLALTYESKRSSSIASSSLFPQHAQKDRRQLTTVVSNARSQFLVLENRDVVAVDILYTSYFFIANSSADRRKLQIYDDDNPAASLLNLQRSVRLASRRSEATGLSSLVLCRNGTGVIDCIRQGTVRSLATLAVSRSTLGCERYSGEMWLRLYATPHIFPGYSVMLLTFALAWLVLGVFSTSYLWEMNHTGDVSFSEVVDEEQDQLHEPKYESRMEVRRYRAAVTLSLLLMAVLRITYIVLIFLWPRTYTSNERDMYEGSEIACREFLFLHYDSVEDSAHDDDTSSSGAAPSYQLILGLFYVSSAIAVLLQQREEDARLSIIAEQNQAAESQSIGLMFLATQVVAQVHFSVLCIAALIQVALSLLVAITVVMLWITTNKDTASSAASCLLVVQAMSGVVLMSISGLSCPHRLLAIFSVRRIRSEQPHQQRSMDDSYLQHLEKQCSRALAYAFLLWLMGSLFVLTSYSTLLQSPLSAFLFYSLASRVVELILASALLLPVYQRWHTQKERRRKCGWSRADDSAGSSKLPVTGRWTRPDKFHQLHFTPHQLEEQSHPHIDTLVALQQCKPQQQQTDFESVGAGSHHRLATLLLHRLHLHKRRQQHHYQRQYLFSDRVLDAEADCPAWVQDWKETSAEASPHQQLLQRENRRRMLQHEPLSLSDSISGASPSPVPPTSEVTKLDRRKHKRRPLPQIFYLHEENADVVGDDESARISLQYAPSSTATLNTLQPDSARLDTALDRTTTRMGSLPHHQQQRGRMEYLPADNAEHV